MAPGRAKRIGLGILVCLALGLTLFFAVRTVQAVQHFQQTHQQVVSGDVRSIRPWMTIPYIARVYRVPESYLLQSLRISDPESVRHVTLTSLAGRLGLTPDALIHDLQTAILTYRQSHPTPPQFGSRFGVASPTDGARPA